MNKPKPTLLRPDSTANMLHLERVVDAFQRPSIVVNERELSVLRRGLTKDGWKRALYLQPAAKQQKMYTGAGLLSTANRWLEADISLSFSNDGPCNSNCFCGNPLEIQHNNNVECMECGWRYHSTDLDDAVQQSRLCALASGALALAMVYGIEKDKAYATKAVQILLMCSELFQDAKGNEARWAIPLAQAYDLIHSARCVSEEERVSIERQLLMGVAEKLAVRECIGSEDAWRIAAIGIIGLTVREPELVGKALQDLGDWLQLLGDDGLSGGTHFDSLEALVHLAEACYRCGVDIYKTEYATGKSIQAMFTAPLKCTYPSFRLPASNDSDYDAFLPLDLYEVAYRRWGLPAYAWVLKRGYSLGESQSVGLDEFDADSFSRTSFFAFLFGRDLPGKTAAFSLKSQLFPSIGICCLRTNSSSMATVDYGPQGEDDHKDMLSFTLFANNQLLIPDYGMPVGGTESRKWHSETWAHNTVVVDGRSQGLTYEHASVTHCFGSDYQGAEFVADDCYPGVTHTRRVFLIGELCILSDVLKSEEDHTYDWLQRCEGLQELIGEYAQCEVAEAPYPMINTAEAYLVQGSAKLQWKCTRGRLDQEIWCNRGQAKLILGSCPSESASRRVPLLICRQQGREAEFTSVFIPSRHEPSSTMTRDGSIITVSYGDNTDYIYMRSATECHEQSIVTDGGFAAICTRKDVIQSMVLAHGSRLEWNGQVMLECPSYAECVEVAFDSRGPQIRYTGGEPGILRLRTGARATRVNGFRAVTSNTAGVARLRITEQMTLEAGLIAR